MTGLKIALGVLLIIVGILVPIIAYRSRTFIKIMEKGNLMYHGKSMVGGWILPIYAAVALIVLGIYLLF